MIFPPKTAVTRLVNSLKGVSSRRLRQAFPASRPSLLTDATPLGPARTSPVGRRPAAQHP
ncbi:transposase [Streptomyces sp. NPDC004009]